MAESSISVAQEGFSCSICLNLLTDPVTLTCGHSYCVSCITGCWDQDDQKRDYSCPQCRQTFTPRPVLGKNTILAEVVEKFKKTKLKGSRPDQCYAEPGDVECDVCTGRKYKAIKSCLVCLESYCQTHFERHEEFRSGKRHKVTDAIGELKEIICSQHDKLLEIFCRTDQRCICYMCMVDEHINHDTVSAAAERTEKQKHLEETKRKFQNSIKEREKELEELRDTVESYKRSAQTAVEDTERIFTELIRSIERSRSEVTQLIRDQEKSAVSQVEEQLKRLEQEIEDLRRRDAEVEQLSHKDNHIHFLQSFQSLSVPPGSTDSSKIPVSSSLSFDDVVKSVSDLREKLEHFCREEIKKISDRGKIPANHESIPTPEYESKKEFLKYFQRFTLDQDTALKNLCLSVGNRVLTFGHERPYHDNPERFDVYAQVLCRESVSGCSYWEVGWTGHRWLTYKCIGRKGDSNPIKLGSNNHSWSLMCFLGQCSFWHNGRNIDLPAVPWPSRIGVYVDQSAGTISFYHVTDKMNLLHRVHTTFTQPLYPAFWIDPGIGVRLFDL
ncbi:E3 ubiquitin/ISG15 ligase TRIM25-like isoform X1 [Carassius gibelio]|uniref:E3 ubiquitin/ISG15 ligase TRIM25-like isoform X1 n=1 Tax=Carassius gibelio TaxID=101364 RepID=UPI0022793DC3|nr:E3 ubiquitin/ISG15 ligase TRIM25-like isoform X1 [Carassius gibelio]